MLVAGVYSFYSLVYSRLWPWNLFFLFFLLSFLGNSAILSRDGADFGSLGLDSLKQEESLEPWVCIFKEVLWDGQWPLG